MQSGYILKTIIIGQNKKPDKSLTLMSALPKRCFSFQSVHRFTDFYSGKLAKSTMAWP